MALETIFSIMSHSISQSFEKECHHLGLLKMDGSDGENLAVTLKKEPGQARSHEQGFGLCF